MRARIILNRAIVLTIGVAGCLGLFRGFGPAVGLLIWVIAIAVICATTAFLLHRQPMGRVTFVNYLAG